MSTASTRLALRGDLLDFTGAELLQNNQAQTGWS